MKNRLILWIRSIGFPERLCLLPPVDPALSLSETGGKYRGAVIDNLITLYHDNLKNALTEYSVTNIQYFPVKLKNPENPSLEGSYWIAKIIGLIECVDRKISTIRKLPSGNGEELGQFNIIASKTKGASVFRLAEEPTLVIMSEKLIDFLVASKIRGVRARETSTEYDGE